MLKKMQVQKKIKKEYAQYFNIKKKKFHLIVVLHADR